MGNPTEFPPYLSSVQTVNEGLFPPQEMFCPPFPPYPSMPTFYPQPSPNHFYPQPFPNHFYPQRFPNNYLLFPQSIRQIPLNLLQIIILHCKYICNFLTNLRNYSGLH